MHSRQLFIVAAPSGAGKTSLLSALLKQDSRVCLSISYTTRKPRPGEKDGQHYHFITTAVFAGMLARNEFVEHAKVFGNQYGTAAHWLREKLTQDQDVILEIDWQGATQVRREFPDSVGIFILPPSPAALAQRLATRKQDSQEIIEQRMTQALGEISHFDEFDYVVINDDFNQALADLHSIVCAQRFKTRFQQYQQADLIKKLLVSQAYRC